MGKLQWNKLIWQLALGERHFMVIVEVSLDTGLLDSVKLFLGNGLKWQTTQRWHWWERIFSFIVEVFQDRALQVGRVTHGIPSSYGRLLCDDTGHGETLHSHCWGLFGHKDLCVSRVMLRIWSQNGRLLKHDARWEILQSLFRRPETQSSESLVYARDSL